MLTLGAATWYGASMEGVSEAELIRRAMTVLSHRRRRVDRQCLVCQAPIPAVTPRRLYCTNRCAQRASRERRRAQQRADR